PAYDPNAAAYHPNAPAYDPNAPAYDPNAAAYDPNAAAYDPNAPAYDPNAPAYDPNAPAYDPNAPAYEAEAPYEPAAGMEGPPGDAELPVSLETLEQSVEPLPAAPDESDWGSVAVDSTTPEAAFEAESAFAESVSLESAEPLLDDANAPAPLPGEGEEPPWAPMPGGDYDGTAWDVAPPADGTSAPVETQPPAGDDLSPLPPESWSGEHVPALVPTTMEFGNYDELATGAVPADAPENLESLLPFDPAAEAVVGADALQALSGPPRDLVDVGLDSAGPPDMKDEEGFHASSSLATDEAAAWQPEAETLDQGFRLESGGSFDASADAAAPDWATGTAPIPGAESPIEGDHPPEPEPSPAAEEVEGLPDLDLSAPELAPQAAEQGDPPWAADTEPNSAAPSVPAPLELDEPERASLPDLEPATDEIPTLDSDVLEEVPADALEIVEAEAPDEGLPVAAASLPSPLPEPVAAPSPPVTPVPEEPAVPVDVVLPQVPEATAAAPGPTPPSEDHRISGVHRVVVHTLEGQVKRGFIVDADLGSPELPLAATAGGPPEPVTTAHVKAVFFMLAPGEQPPPPTGSKVRVTFRDGRQVAGFSPDYQEGTAGFFIIPADARTSTGRIWVYRSAVKQVAVS
ncbi:MAG TPA: hypothetical protein VFG53_02395, partial [Anaeromyxobacter sp.]|nr:hypothetical protein [Anaeromyxobacter sp.]